MREAMRYRCGLSGAVLTGLAVTRAAWGAGPTSPPENDRLNDAPANWFIDRWDPLTDVNGAFRPIDFDYAIVRDEPLSGGSPSYYRSSLFYYSSRVENLGSFRLPTGVSLQQFGPSAPSFVENLMLFADARPVDIEYKRLVTEQGPNGTVVLNDEGLTALAVPNTGANAAAWDILFNVDAATIQALQNSSNPALRPIDIEVIDPFAADADRRFVVLVVENEPGSPTGQLNWRARFNMTASDLSFFQQVSPGRIVDLEPHWGDDWRDNNSQLFPDPQGWDAIFVGDEPSPYQQVLSQLVGQEALAEPLFIDEFDALPPFGAGYRVTDYERFFTGEIGQFGDLEAGVDAVLIDSATDFQRRVRTELSQAAVNTVTLDSTIGALRFQVIGESPTRSIHRDLRLDESGAALPPANYPFIAAYAVLNDDLSDSLSYQFQFFTPTDACPPFTKNATDVRTIGELVERMIGQQNNISADALMSERYSPPAVNAFADSFEEFGPAEPPTRGYLNVCDRTVSLQQLSNLIVAAADGSLATGAQQAALLDVLFAPPDPALAADIETLIDQTAAEPAVVVTPGQLAEFKSRVVLRSRELSVPGTYTSPNGTSVPTLRLVHLVLADLPRCSRTGSLETVQAAISAYAETASQSPRALDDAIVEALRSEVRAGLLGWADCAPEPCPGDVTGDGVVDGGDLLEVINNFGASGAPGSTPGDVTGDGQTDGADLLDVINNFGSPC